MSKSTDSNKRLSPDQEKQLLLRALEATMGIVTPALKQVQIPRTRFRRYLRDDPEFAAQVDDIKEIFLDFAEHALLQKIQQGDSKSIIFFLRTQGKGRGYQEKPLDRELDGKRIEIRLVAPPEEEQIPAHQRESEEEAEIVEIEDVTPDERSEQSSN